MREHLVLFIEQKKKSSGALKAIKFLNASINESSKILKYLKEAKIGLQTKHPNILTIEEVWYDGTRFFFIMDLIEPLTSSNLPESRKEKLVLFQQLVSAVAHLYSKGVLHRDIKIQNCGIMLDETPQLVLFDFGEATEILADYQECVGTTLHIAPEALNFYQYSDKSEIWALISFLIEILTGKAMILHLFSGALGSVAPLHVQLKIDSLKEPPIPTVFKEDYSPDGKLLLKILERGLAIDPKERLSFSELESILQELFDIL
jgi:serine/threonine protein kinase